MPWQDNLAWDAELEEADGINVGGERFDDHRRDTVFLYRPELLVCDSTVWTAPRGSREKDVRDRLRDGGASDVAEDDVRNAAADRLGLRLLSVPDSEALRLVREARDIMPGTVGLNHVLVADPQRYGGCAVPEPVGSQPTVEIPGPGTEAAALKVAVLDTGVSDGVPFAFDPASDREPPGPTELAAGHGTMVAGVIARFGRGATILVKQVLCLPLGVADELAIADALDALPDDVDVINASFGGQAADDDRMLALERALDRLPESTLVIASAGNEGSDRPHYMAAFDRVVGVTSAGDVGREIAVFDYGNRGDWVDLSTQGTDIETVRGPGDFVLASGTSFAAPKIACEAMKLPGGTTGVREAAEWLSTQSGGPTIPGGGTFIDIPGH